jgi:hypothetical protein
MSAGRIGSPRERITARSTTFFSSRMFPGQSCSASRARAAAGNSGAFFRIWRAVLGEAPDERGQVLLPRPKRGKADRKDLEAVEEVLPERAVPHERREVPVRRDDDPDVHRDGHRPSDPEELPLLDDPQELGLGRRGQLRDLVEKQRSPVGQLEAAGPALLRTGVRPPLVPEQLVLDEPFRNRGDVDGHERPRGTRRESVERPGEELFPRSGLAGQDHGDVGRGGPPDPFESLGERGRRADDRRHAGQAGLGREEGVRDRAATRRHVPLHEELQQVGVDRLAQEVRRARLHRGDGRLHGAEARQHDDRQPGIRRRSRREDRETVRPGELQVGENEAVAAAGLQPPDGLVTGRDGLHAVALPLEGLRQHRAERLPVLDEQDLGRHGAAGSGVPRARVASSPPSGPVQFPDGGLGWSPVGLGRNVPPGLSGAPIGALGD